MTNSKYIQHIHRESDGPAEVSPEEALPEISFDQLPEPLRAACERAGWDRLMPVQSKSMPYMLARRDLMVQARTGSGKTGAFVLPLLDRIDPSKNHCQALILLPTRELAKQVAREAETLSGGTIRTVAVYGGVGYGEQIEGFKQGAHIVVGTPGRVLDHLLKGSLSLDKLETLIFDEADRMLSIGFYPDMKQVQRYLPKRRINSLMFSATFPPLVLRLAEEFLTDRLFISLSGKQVHVAAVHHVYYEVPAMGKDRALMRIIEVENPSSAIIFCNTKANCHYVSEVLRQFGYDADALSSDLSQSKREQILNRVRSGALRFLVATDVAARGIDIPDLSHVVLYEPPEDHESYIHRAGRTGRAGAAGEVLSLVDVMQKLELNRIATQYSIELEKRPLPEDEDVRQVLAQRATTLLESKVRSLLPISRERMSRFIPLAKELAASEDGPAIIATLLDEFYHENVHAKAVPAPERQDAPRKGRGAERRKPGPRSGQKSGKSERAPEKRESPKEPAAPKKQKASAESSADNDQANPKKKRRRRRRKKPTGNDSSSGGNQSA
ncbi:MAG: DEAD/DEAH box helicase [Desulfovibrio sp.]|jgi:ATP-dependent RNA helicase DeaD|nr:DEAD/DEAH box helicase [Desulfovibrio sp.]